MERAWVMLQSCRWATFGLRSQVSFRPMHHVHLSRKPIATNQSHNLGDRVLLGDVVLGHNVLVFIKESNGRWLTIRMDFQFPELLRHFLVEQLESRVLLDDSRVHRCLDNGVHRWQCTLHNDTTPQ